MNGSPADLAVIVFAYNEAENVAPVLRELCGWLDQHEPDHELIFIDDGSRDGTAEVARSVLSGRRAQVLRHAHNRGIGAALKTAVAASHARWVTFMPADGQIEPAAIGTLRAAAQPTAAGEPAVDVVFSVYDDRNDGLDRKLLSLGVRALIAIVHQVVVRSDGVEQLRPDAS